MPIRTRILTQRKKALTYQMLLEYPSPANRVKQECEERQQTVNVQEKYFPVSQFIPVLQL
jgi:hypothetical protein